MCLHALFLQARSHIMRTFKVMFFSVCLIALCLLNSMVVFFNSALQSLTGKVDNKHKISRVPPQNDVRHPKYHL